MIVLAAETPHIRKGMPGPVMTRQQAIAELCAPGQPYELKTSIIQGRSCRVFVNAPPNLRVLYAENTSDLDFLVYEDERLSFEEVYRQACALATAMVEDYGVGHGDRVAIAMRNYPEWTAAFLAATSIGAIAVSINAWWNASELSYALLDCSPVLIIADGERLDRLADCEDLPPKLRAIRVRAQPHPRITTEAWEEVLGNPGNAVMPEVSIDPDDDATIIYTSGSTGHPKGVLSTHRNSIHALLSWELDWELRARLGVYVPPEVEYQQGMLLAIPLFHVAGSHAAMLSAFRPQRKMILMYKWDVRKGMELIERERLTVFTSTPAISGDLVNASGTTDRDLSSLLVMGGGGGPRAPQQVHAIDRLSKIIIPHTGFGMTELSAIGTSNAGADYLEHPSSSGLCSLVLDMRVVDKDGTECESGEAGELQVRGTTLFREYWNRPGATARSFDGEWFRTGDMATIDPDGFVFIVDRIKDLVIRGGENVGCGGVESALLEHPDVIEACVYGVPDTRLGEEIGATLFVSREIAENDLLVFLSERLAHFETPRFIHQQTEPLLRTASAKIYKKQIRDEALKRL